MCLQAERVLTLWRDGKINCENVAAFQAWEASSSFISSMNTATGRVVKEETKFNQKFWGGATKAYLVSAINSLAQREKFDELLDKVNHYIRSGRRGDPRVFLTAMGTIVDEQALLKDDSD
jgi:hypothetical protein